MNVHHILPRRDLLGVSCLTGLFLAVLTFSSPFAQANQVCRHKGEVVDLDDRDVKVFIEGEVRCERTVSGNQTVLERLILSKGKTLERELRSKDRHELRRYKIINGNERHHGEQMDYFPGTEKLKRRWKENDGFTTGIEESFFESGKLKSKALYFKEGDKPGAASQTSMVEFHENGKLAFLRCGTTAESSVDPKLCGFGAIADVVTFDKDGEIRSKMKLKNGVALEKEEISSRASIRPQRSQFNTEAAAKVLSTLGKDGELQVSEFYKNGKLKWRYTLNGKRHRVGSDEEWYQDGQKARSTAFSERAGFSAPIAVKTTCWWQNGQLMWESELLPDKEVAVKIKSYWDSGKPQREGIYMPIAAYQDYEPLNLETCDGRFSLTQKGPIKDHDQNGILQTESTYEKGRLARRVFYKEDGTIDKTEEYFPDGSRKP